MHFPLKDSLYITDQTESWQNYLQVKRTTQLLCGSGLMRDRPNAVHPVVPITSWSTMSCPTENKLYRRNKNVPSSWLYTPKRGYHLPCYFVIKMYIWPTLFWYLFGIFCKGKIQPSFIPFYSSLIKKREKKALLGFLRFKNVNFNFSWHHVML